MSRSVLSACLFLGCVLASCGSEGADITGQSVSISSGARDLTTGYSADIESEQYPFWFDPTDLPAGYVSEDTIRLVHWPSGDLVPGDWRESTAERVPGRVVLRFQASRQLDDGWYAMQIRMPRWNFAFAAPSLEVGDGWRALRGRIGTQPTARLYVASNEEFAITLSEDITLEVDSDILALVDYRVDGRRSRCQSYGLDSYPVSRGSAFNGFTVVCEAVPAGGTAELRFGEGLRALGGPPVIDYRGNHPAAWTIRADQPGAEVVPDTYFAVASTAEGL